MVPSKRTPLYGRPGDFNDFAHGTSVLFKQIIRQIRRLSSIRNWCWKATQTIMKFLLVNGSMPQCQGFSPELWSLVYCQKVNFHRFLDAIDTILDAWQPTKTKWQKLNRCSITEMERVIEPHADPTRRKAYRFVKEDALPPIQAIQESVQWRVDGFDRLREDVDKNWPTPKVGSNCWH